MNLAALLAFALTVGQFNLPTTTELPQIALLTPYEMQALQCDNKCNEMPFGIYRPTSPTILFISADVNPDTVFGRSIVVHEMVHYLQNVSGQLPSTTICSIRLPFELTAIDIQERYIQANGYPTIKLDSMRKYYINNCKAEKREITL